MTLITRRAVVGTVGVMLAGAAAGAYLRWGRGGASSGPAPAGLPPATAPVTRGTLTNYVDLDGTVAYGEVLTLQYTPPVQNTTPPPASPAAASPPATPPADDFQQLVTWLPKVGTVIGRGKPLFRVDNRPVMLLFGALPVYRSLLVGVSGPDVKALKTNLRALGYGGFGMDEAYTMATGAAVKRWQRELDIEETGKVVPGQVVYAAAAIRVVELRTKVGASAAGDILTYSATRPMIAISLPETRRAFVAKGTQVSVSLSGGKAVTGTIDNVVTAPAGDGGQPSLAVSVSVADPALLEGLESVRVRLTTEERENVLMVPVTALVALPDGGYGVQVVEGLSSRFVPVETGLFARGQVEITKGDLRAGVSVGVPN